jgi:hypothetical protein
MNNVFALATALLIASVIAQGGSCGANSAKPVNANSEMRTSTTNEQLPDGVWGGQHVRAEITESGVQFEFDCARGTIGKRLTLDAGGKFDVLGKFAIEHAGPSRDGEESNDRSVRYAGNVKDQEMTLTITDSNTKEEIGTFTLKRGSEGRLMKCR